MEYQTPYILILSLSVTVLWALDFWKVFQKAQLRIPFKNIKKTTSYYRLGIFILGLLGWLFISYASMTPRKALKFLPGNIKVNDIFFVVDVSRSMLADDLRPNRLEVAKKKLREFAALRPTDRIGIVMFSEKVFTLLPLTTDPQLVDQMLADIRVGFLGSGTNIGDALALAVGRAEASETQNKVIVLLTDGVNNVGNIDPMKAANMAADYNIKVYTIGLGTIGDGARIPIGKNAFGSQYQSIPGGSIDLKTLRDISEKTNGKSYMADSEGSLKEILSEIQELEKTEIKSQGQIVYEEKFLYYFLIGLGLLFMAEIIRKFIIREVV